MTAALSLFNATNIDTLAIAYKSGEFRRYREQETDHNDFAKRQLVYATLFHAAFQ